MRARRCAAVLTCLAVGLSVAVTACGGDSGPTLKVVSDLSLQGDSERGRQMVRAIKHVIKEKYRGHVIKGKYVGRAGRFKFEFESMDHSTAAAGWDAGRCVDNARSYVSDKAIVGVIGTAASGCAQYEIPILNKEHVAMVSPADTAVGLTKGGLPGTVPGQPERYYPSGTRSFFRLVASDEYQGLKGAKFMKSLGLTRVYVLHDKGLYGKGVADAFRFSAKDNGLKIVGGGEGWDKDPKNYPKLIARIRKSGADGIYLGGSLSSNGRRLVNEILDETEGVRLLLSDGFVSSSIFPVALSETDEVFGTLPGKATVPSELKTALEKEESDTQVDPYAVYAAAAAEVLLDAIRRSNGSREDVIAKLFETDLKTVAGHMSFEGTGDPEGAGEKDIVVYRACHRSATSASPTDVWFWKRVDSPAGRADTCQDDEGA